MVRLIAIDPHIHFFALARFEMLIDKWELDSVVITKKTSDTDKLVYQAMRIGIAFKPGLVIIEHPFTYPVEKQKGDPNDITRLAYMAGVIGSAIASSSSGCILESVTPREWKGSVPKHIHNDRTLAQCPKAARLIADLNIPKSQHNHIWDAVALGLWKTERIGR